MDIEVAETYLCFPSPPSVDSYSPNGYRGVNDSSSDVFMPPVSRMEYTITAMAPHPPQPRAPAIFATNHFHQQPYLTDGGHAMGPGLDSVSSGDFKYETIEAQLDFSGIEMLLTEPLPSDLGPSPMPVREPRPDGDPPRTKESAYAPTPSPINSHVPLHDRSHFMLKTESAPSSVHSDPDIRRSRTTCGASAEGPRARVRKRLGRGDYFKRATSPMFPDNSVPLARLSSSNASLNSIQSDPFGTISSRHSGPFSDPGVYAVNVTRHQGSAQNSPAVDANSPRFIFGQSQSSNQFILNSGSSTRSCLEVEMPMKYVRKISDLDKRIMKLQVERSRVLEKASQVCKSDAPTTTFWQDDKWPLAMEKAPETGRVHLYVFHLGIHALDEPFFEEANSILRHIGGLYYDLQSAITHLWKVCYKGMIFQPDISTCFAYIKSLMQEHQRLKLTAPVNGLYKIEVDMDAGTSTLVPPEFEHTLEVANEVLRSALIITQSYTHIQMKLQDVQTMATDKVHQCDSVCNELGILDRDRRNQIRMVLEGNATAVSSALRTWPQHFQFATENIRAVVECIHPSM